MILLDGKRLDYVRFSDGTTGVYLKDTTIFTLEWIYECDLSEAFVCLQLLAKNFVSTMIFTYLPFGRQDSSDDFDEREMFMRLFMNARDTEANSEEYETNFLVRDAHSPSENFVSFTMHDLWFTEMEYAGMTADNTLIVFPDKAARDKYREFYEDEFTYTWCRTEATKFEFDCDEELPDLTDAFTNIVVIDDICDDDEKFIKIAEHVPDKERRKLFLFTTYGLYSKGFSGLFGAGFKEIHCKHNIKHHGRTFFEDQAGRVLVGP